MKKWIQKISNFLSFIVCLFTLTVVFFDVSHVFFQDSMHFAGLGLYVFAAYYFIFDASLRVFLSGFEWSMVLKRIFDFSLIGLLFLPHFSIIYPPSFLAIILIVCIAGRLDHLVSGLRFFNLSPEQLFLMGFVYVAFIGMLLLSLPISLKTSVPMIDIMFTAVSSICVTGLLTLDVSQVFSPFGQGVLLLLIQMGGLGVMTFYALFSMFSHKKLSQKEQAAYEENLTAGSRQEFFALIRTIIKVTLGFELCGALLLWGFFISQGNTSVVAAGQAVFLAVSGFCNAGITNLSEGLQPFSNNPGVLLTIAALIVVGGLGFPVLFDCAKSFRRKHTWATMKAQTKLCLCMSLILIISSSLSVFFLEIRSAYEGQGVFEAAIQSLFHAISSRTAGFSTHSLTLFHPATLWLLIIFMFIGTAPGSTGGGIKTSTAGLLLITLWRIMRGENQIQLFGRTIPKDNIFRLISVTSIALITVAVVVFVLLLLEKKSFFTVIFETVSAFATVGYSLDATDSMETPAKCVLMATMFFGRLGPLTIAFALTRRRSQAHYAYPEERILIG